MAFERNCVQLTCSSKTYIVHWHIFIWIDLGRGWVGGGVVGMSLDPAYILYLIMTFKYIQSVGLPTNCIWY